MSNVTSPDLLPADGAAWSITDGSVCFYTLTCFLLGFCGNLFVLVSSHFYNSLDLDKITMVFVKHLALADLLLVTNTILPTLVSVFTKTWLLGQVLCDVTAHFNFIPVLVNVHLVLFLSLFKILVCKFPFRMRSFKAHHARYLVVVSYLNACVEFSGSVFLGKVGVYKPSPIFRCLSALYGSHPRFLLVSLVLRFVIPLLMMVISNSWLLYLARTRFSGGSQYKALITVCAITGLFIVSWTPKMIYVAALMITKKQVPWAVAFSHYFPFINSVGNPLIYTVTNKKYSDFVRSMVTRKMTTAAALVMRNKVATAGSSGNTASAGRLSVPATTQPPKN